MLHVLCRWRGEKWLSRVMPAPQRRLDLGLLFSKHKFTMAAAEASIPVPKWSPATTWEEAVRAAEEFGYPMMLKKPVGFAGSGVRMASSREDLRAAYDQFGWRRVDGGRVHCRQPGIN